MSKNGEVEGTFLERYLEQVDKTCDLTLEALPHVEPEDLNDVLDESFKGWCEALEEHGLVADKKAIEVAMLTASAILSFEYAGPPPLPGVGPSMWASMILRRGLTP